MRAVIALLLALALPGGAWAAWAPVGTATGCLSVVSLDDEKEATCDKPAGVVDGHMMVAWIFSSSNQAVLPITLTAPAGWITVREHQVVQNGRTNLFAIQTRVADSEPANYEWVSNDDDVAATLAIVVLVNAFSGLTGELDTPYVPGSHEDVADTGRIVLNAPDVTTETDGALVMTFFGATQNSITEMIAPAGMTLSGENIASARNSAVAYIDGSTAGAQSLGAWGNTGTIGSIRAVGATVAFAATPLDDGAALRRRRQ